MSSRAVNDGKNQCSRPRGRVLRRCNASVVTGILDVSTQEPSSRTLKFVPCTVAKVNKERKGAVDSVLSRMELSCLAAALGDVDDGGRERCCEVSV